MLKASETPKKEEKPLYLGHRARLRARFLADNGASMPDYEMLELLLMMSIPRRDVKPLAKHLIAKFGNLNGVINAPIDELLDFKGVSKSTTGLFKMVEKCRKMLGSANLSSESENEIFLWSDFVQYCGRKVREIGADELQIFFFNDGKKLLGDKSFSRGRDEGESINLQKLIQEIIELGATRIVLAHAHSEEKLKTTKGDIQLTETICEAVYPFGVTIVDHLLFSAKNEEVFSFSDNGELPSGVLKHQAKQKKIMEEIRKLGF